MRLLEAAMVVILIPVIAKVLDFLFTVRSGVDKTFNETGVPVRHIMGNGPAEAMMAGVLVALAVAMIIVLAATIGSAFRRGGGP